MRLQNLQEKVMVKKIRVIEEKPAEVETPENPMMEIAKSMDWKLWEMLQVLQRLEKKVDSLEVGDDDADE